MNKREVGMLVGVGIVGLAGVALAATGMPWEKPLDTVATSLTGKAGVSAATVGVAWTAINWGRGTEHGKEWFLGTAMGVGGTLGAASVVNVLGGGAGAATLVPLQIMSTAVFISDLAGELLGYLVYASWLFAGVLRPLVWRKYE